MRKFVIGNWKMNGSRAMAWGLTEEVAGHCVENSNEQVEVVICPPSIFLQELSGFCDDHLSFGAQDCRAEESGAYTGDISAPMIASVGGVDYVILGHSERRAGHGESDALVASKAATAKKAELKPVICIGETLEQRESGEYEAVLAEQVKGSIPSDFTADDYLLAYEPVWAIGTGKVADEATIEATHRFIAGLLPKGVAILYGGSVKPNNAQAIMSIPHVDGVLVGGASLQAEDFNAIIAAAGEAVKSTAQAA